ncbi:RagB/SusD family nutrient uptake outer membrane protein [Sphingobacterium sp. DR205]|uniref:RagB/SusD family nutrient uptake outer membrane protein n=1 Tax=Sphingobacterium sp. DR205 TaxID=2713573 RepID=UPI0013E4E242|nr:RagB/SusD family nutrient uptake outer membrane protein [Sphingobacterium sp. DR205]QIH35291.1 RagB/SusD family nutrient uptake outer membrane protein [Sphingobacterium sp. DR205]
MKIFKISIIAAALVTSFSSCKDFLDVEPGNSIDAGTALNGANDARNRINGLSRLIASSSYYGRNFELYGEVKGGDLTVYSQGRGLDQLYSFNQDAETNNFSGFWSQIYYCIAQTNDVLEKIDQVAMDSKAQYANAQGQLLTLRALFYFDLVRLYGKSYTQDKASRGVPIVISPASYNSKPARATVEEVYTQILKDLKTGQELLGANKAIDNGYINYYANLAIQSRVYLTMADYENAYSKANEIITSGTYKLYENEKWTSSWASMYGTESIYELGINEGEADLGTASLGYYLMRRTGGQGGMFYASDYYLNRMKEDNSDVRWAILGRDESSATRMGAVYKNLGSVNTNTSLPLNSLGDKGNTNNTAVNIKVIRLSEIYLIAAEAALKKPSADPAKSAELLNAISKRSPNRPAFSSATVNEDAILNEKSKELFGEGHRYWDMIRLNKKITFNDDFQGLTIKTRPKEIDRTFEKYILPIPQSEINANPTLKEQQNPGY